ncbi:MULTISPECIES: sugar phosphate nucleotidyltransferase [Paenibacillus]|uniref:Glucose-1-phosphate thymidylyltransferase n=2 Tax=Paenibacillus TaxID=44249 RepID=A0AAP5H572_PAEAM|nr:MULTISPECIES: sugar phosphate nucleotidyltransferase [Paenibacillus]KQY80712.1 spore coat protein [Paenibacillus sp. Root52]MCG7380560.1 NTP transferase domain-containing protein [Paenibacillus sp. ACRSA]MDQ0172055.1 glucose-1-phosphate thymidylyltransferase [Paenibacillus tundrae]MDR6724948.1 glucose-1-phosphate thymidylyltransferase [Paenibacillus amylolyticus]
MKGVILAGGTGTRLYPLTRLINKHLLPVGKHPMIVYGIDRLRQAGIEDILIVMGKQSAGLYTDFLGGGAELGVRLTYRIQEKAGGIAEALDLARSFILPGERFVVLLGDNLFSDDLKPYVDRYVQQPEGTARVLLKKVDDARRYGVPEFDPQHPERITHIEEKPSHPKTSYCVTGIYMYDDHVFNLIGNIAPSARGELEITDVNNHYAAAGGLEYDILQKYWSDAGTFESLQEASVRMKGQLP